MEKLIGSVTLKAVFSTDTSYEIQIAGSQFPPNAEYWFGLFYPDGRPGEAKGILSDSQGDLCLPDGSKNIYAGTISNQKIQTGKYRAVVTTRDIEFSAKFFSSEWK